MDSNNIQSIEHHKIPGYQPINCGELKHHERAERTAREAYRTATKWIGEDPFSNCCTVGSEYRVKCFQATVFPVKLEKVERNVIFFYSSVLNVEFPAE